MKVNENVIIVRINIIFMIFELPKVVKWREQLVFWLENYHVIDPRKEFYGRINVGTYKFVIVIATSVFQVNSPVTENNTHLSDMDIALFE